MRVAIIGAGRIGAGIAPARLADHELLLAFSRDPVSLRRLAAEIVPGVAAAPELAVALAEVVVISVPWDTLARVLEQTGPLDAKVVIDTTGRTGPDRVAQWLCGDDEDAKLIVAGLIEDAGFAALDIGWTAQAAPMESPRRRGALYGEECHLNDARAALAAIRAGESLPPVPRHSTP